MFQWNGPRRSRLTLAITVVLACQAAPHVVHGSTDGHPSARPGQAHHRVDEGDEAHQPRLYYRPFCRRSHWARSRSAPCWE